MPPTLRSIAPILLGIASAQVAQGLLGPLIPLLLLEQEVGSSQIGLVASAFSFGFLLGAIYCPRVVLRLGHGRAFVAMAVIAADATLVMALWPSPWAWALLRAVVGIAYAGMCLVVESWLNARADNASRGRVFALYMVASWGGGAAGPLVLNLLPPSVALIAAAGMAYVTALLPVALAGQPNPRADPHSRMGLLALARISPVGIACSLTAGLANSVFHALAPVYLKSLGHGASAVAIFATAASLAGLAVQWPAGLLSDRVGRRPVALASLLAGAGLAIAFLLVGAASLPVLLGLGLLLSGMAAPLYGLAAGQTNDRLESGDAVAAAGGLLLVWSIGATIGPAAAGLVMQVSGPAGLFTYLAVVFGAVALFTALRMASRAEVPREQRGKFMPAPPPTTGMASSARGYGNTADSDVCTTANSGPGATSAASSAGTSDSARTTITG